MQSHPPADSQFFRRRILKVIFFSLLTAIIGFLCYQAYFYYNPQARINFATYKLNATEVKEEKLILFTSTASLFGDQVDIVISPHVKIEFTVKSENITVTQEKSHHQLDCSARFKVTRDTTCTLKTASGQQQYMHVIERFDNPPSLREYVYLIKDGSYITLQTSGNATEQKADSEWQRIINIFKREDFKNLKIERHHPGT